MVDLRSVLAKIDGAFLGSSEFVPTMPFCRLIPSGIPALDSMIIGFPSWTEVYGVESSGKSTLALHVAAQATKADIPTVYLDSEESLILEANRERAKAIGVDLSKLIIIGSTTVENGFSIIRNVCDELKGTPPLIIWDTLSVCPTEKESDDDASAGMAERARIIRKMVRKLIYPPTSANFIIINHAISSLNPYGEREVSPGGSGIKFQAQLRLIVKPKTKWDEDGKDAGVYIRKSKQCVPYRESCLPLDFTKGFLPYHSVLYALVGKSSFVECNKSIYKVKINPDIEELTMRWDTVEEKLKNNPIIYETLLKELYRLNAPKWYHQSISQLSKSKCFSKSCAECTKREKESCLKVQKERLGLL